MKFERSNINARDLGSVYNFAFGGDINDKPRLTIKLKNSFIIFPIFREAVCKLH